MTLKLLKIQEQVMIDTFSIKLTQFEKIGFLRTNIYGLIAL